jgi:hypothetical protein
LASVTLLAGVTARVTHPAGIVGVTVGGDNGRVHAAVAPDGVTIRGLKPGKGFVTLMYASGGEYRIDVTVTEK